MLAYFHVKIYQLCVFLALDLITLGFKVHAKFVSSFFGYLVVEPDSSFISSHNYSKEIHGLQAPSLIFSVSQ